MKVIEGGNKISRGNLQNDVFYAQNDVFLGSKPVKNEPPLKVIEGD